MPLATTRLGPLTVSVQGFGCMGLSHTYGRAGEAESIATLHRAVAQGVTFFDTADIYGDGHNETLVGKALKPHRASVVIATKFGNVLHDQRKLGGPSLDGSPAYVVSACEASLRRLGIDTIDLYYQHRVDPATSIEDTIGAMARLVEQGKVRALGLSEVSAPTLRRAMKVHPIAAVQNEYSLWTRDYEAGVLPVCRELGAGFVAYSPLGRGFLAGQEAGGADDRRHAHPRFAAAAVTANKQRRGLLDKVATRLGATGGQVALAWVMAKGAVPIPGTRHVTHLDANLAAAKLKLDAATMAELEAAFPPGSTVGERYPADAMLRVNA